MYEYAGTVVEVVDGDTVRMDMDLGFSIRQRMALRLYGINAPETVGETRAAGLAAKDFLRTLLLPGMVVTVKTFKDKGDKYGRLLADILNPAYPTVPGVTVNLAMIEAGHASAYFGGKR